MDRRFLYVLLAIIALLAGAVMYEFSRPITYYGSLIQPPKPMPDFTLPAANGPVTLSDFRGRYVALYFGYTSCPDICPATSAALKAALSQLGGQDSQVQVIFISVDYKRDTPEKLFTYMQNFRPDFLGVVGTEAETDQVTRDFGIFYQLNEPDPSTGAYTVDHYSNILVLDRQGALAMTWAYDQQPDEIASDLRNLLKK